MSNLSLRVAGYRRVSMREQVDGHSLAAQENNIRQYATTNDWQLTKIYTDAGISAKKGSQRPALQSLLEDAEAGQFDVVIVDKVDRFYRHLNSLLTALEQLNSWHVSFVSVQERLDFSTAWGKLTLTMLGTLAEIYIDNLRQETKKGKIQRARDGLWNGNIPYGYCRGNCSACTDPNGEGYCPDFGKEDKTTGPNQLAIHPVDSQVVKRIYQLYLSEKYSDASIARWAQAHKVKLPNGEKVTPRTKGIPGLHAPGIFKKDYARTILTNIFYTGMVPYFSRKKGQGKSRIPQKIFQGRHRPIISQEEYEQVQVLRKQIGKALKERGNTLDRVYPLTGTLFCGHCGSPFRGSSTKKNRYYRDASRVEYYGSCQQSHLKAEEIEEKVLEWLKRQFTCPEIKQTLGKQTKLIDKIRSREKRAKDLYLSGTLPQGDYEGEKKRCETLLTPLLENQPDARITLLMSIQSQLTEWKNISSVKQKRLLQVSVEAVYVRGNSLVGVQPTIASLPLLGEGCKCGLDGRRDHRAWRRRGFWHRVRGV
ncbi:MAG: recombinase family protein [Anaerolineae bacterium]|jgi:DNA invertase Pin-like site-specific DNA recombinase|nr:recombinase family protein [Anaerolineae bacterium]